MSLILLGAALLAGGCAGSGRHLTGWGEITIAPGDTATCSSTPCRVFYTMPAGNGTYRVTGNEVTLGQYPAGQVVSLGSFYESQAIKMPGTDTAPAYVYIAQSESSGD